MIIKLKYEDIPNLVEDIVVSAFLFFTIYSRMFAHNEDTLELASNCLIVAGTIGILRMLRDRNSRIFLYIIFTLCCWGISFFYRLGEWIYDIRDISNTIFFMGIAYSFVKKNPRIWLYASAYYFTVIYVFLQVVVWGKSYRSVMVDGNSYNYISAFVVFLYCLYVFAQEKRGRHPSIVQNAIFAGILLITYGRGGIITAFIYGLLFIYLRLYEGKKKVYTYALAAGCLFAVFFSRDFIIGYFIEGGALNKFLEYGLNSNGRLVLWETYLKNCVSGVSDFIFGANPVLLRPDANLHNSFLQMWASLGFIFFSVNIILMICESIRAIKGKRYYYVIVFIAFCVRAFTDKMMFRWYGEILMYYYVFGYLLDRNREEVDI